MSYGGNGMKLRDLARSSGNSNSFVSALLAFRSRFRDRETTRTRSPISALWAPERPEGLLERPPGILKKLPSIRADHTSPSPDRLPLWGFSHPCSKKPWAPFLVFFITPAILAPSLVSYSGVSWRSKFPSALQARWTGRQGDPR